METLDMSDGGKGSGRRPQAVSDERLMENWSHVFGPSKLEQRAAQERALDEMVRINQELGLYDEPTLQESEKPPAGVTGYAHFWKIT